MSSLRTVLFVVSLSAAVSCSSDVRGSQSTVLEELFPTCDTDPSTPCLFMHHYPRSYYRVVLSVSEDGLDLGATSELFLTCDGIEFEPAGSDRLAHALVPIEGTVLDLNCSTPGGYLTFSGMWADLEEADDCELVQSAQRCNVPLTADLPLLVGTFLVEQANR